MNKTKIAKTRGEDTVKRLDPRVRENMFSNRSQAVQETVKDKLERIERSRFARECAKLDPKFEKAMAEEGLTGDLSEWPEY